MGMFDTVYVDQSLIEEAVKGTDLSLKASEGYCSFQTKDLDDALASFYIQKDGSFCQQHQEYKWIKPDDGATKGLLSLGYQEPVGEPEYIADNRNAYFDFYDFYYTDKERVWVTFTAHVSKGKLIDSIFLKDFEKTDLEEEAIKNKKQRDEWNKVCATWQWRLATFLFDIRVRVKRLLYPITSKLDALDNYLRKEAKKTHNYE